MADIVTGVNAFSYDCNIFLIFLLLRQILASFILHSNYHQKFLYTSLSLLAFSIQLLVMVGQVSFLFPLIFLRAIPPLRMPILLLGGIYSGAFTPTEAAAVSAFYALLLSVFAYKAIGFKDFLNLVIGTVKTTAVVTLVLCGAFIFNYVVTIEQIPQATFDFINQFELTTVTFFLAINALYLVMGCFLDVSTIMLVITPLFIPAAAAMGIDLHHFGIVVVFNMMIGLITPPYGILLFIIKALNGIPLGEMISEIWIFVGVLIALLMLITYVPELVLWLPRTAGLIT